MLEGDSLVNEAIRDMFVLFWKIVMLPAEKALSYFCK